MYRDALCALGLVLCLTGCATQVAKSGPVAASTVVQFPAPDQLPKPPGDYRIKAGDTVDVSVFRQQEMTRSGVITETGLFTMPPIGDIMVVGKTSAEVREIIRAALTPDYIRDPLVTVSVKALQVPERVTVLGAVGETGNFVLDRPMTLTQVIAEAKGPAYGADMHHVVIFRKIAGQRSAGVFDYSKILLGQENDQPIYADDEINIPSNTSLDNFKSVLGAVPVLSFLLRL